MAIHAQQIERYGGSHGVTDSNVVLSALARARNMWAYDSTSDIADLAAAYLVGFARSQGFSDGNKRTGLACALVFLSLNGAALNVKSSELFVLVMDVATGQADDRFVAVFIRDHLARKK